MLRSIVLVNRKFPFSRFLSSFSKKNYICDSSVIETYQTNKDFKSIINRQEHQFYYQDDKQLKQKLPSVFNIISEDSKLPDNPYYLTK